MSSNGSPSNSKDARCVRAKRGRLHTTLSHLPGWKLEDAKAKLSELVRLARTRGPQRVTYRGEDAVVVLAVGEFERLASAELPRGSWIQFLQSSGLGDIDVTREQDRGREVAW